MLHKFPLSFCSSVFINTTHANVDTRFQLHLFNALTKAKAESAKQLYNFALFMIKSPYIYLLRQKYPESLIKAGIEKAKALDRDAVGTVKNKNEQGLITYVSTHNPRQKEIFGNIENDLHVLKRDNRMKEVLEPYKIIKSKRQPKNLKKLLTKTKFTEMQNIPKVTRCNKSKCGLCKHLIDGEEFKFKCGKAIKVACNISCDVKKPYLRDCLCGV